MRMGAATEALPKPMLLLGGKPILEHQLEWLKASGITEVFISLGYKAEAVTDYFKDGKRWGMKLRYQVEKMPRGTAGAVRDLVPQLGTDALIVYGDLYVNMNCGKFLDFHAAHGGAASLVLIESDHPLDSDLARMENNRITGFYRAQSGQPYENLAAAAVWAVRKPLLNLISADKPSDFGRDIFPSALAQGMVLMGYRTKETLADLGTPERLDAFLRR